MSSRNNLANRIAAVSDMEGATRQIVHDHVRVDPQLVIDRRDDITGRDRETDWIRRLLVGGAMHVPAFQAAAKQ